MGFLNIHKPSGPTSHDLVLQVRRAISVKQVGHAGTLDPLADGVLVVAVGYATRLIEYLKTDKKRYRAVATLGYGTDTYDRQGKVVQRSDITDGLTSQVLFSTVEAFIGSILQSPPAFSALKVDGQRAYELARRGVAVELKPRLVTIYDCTVESVNLPDFVINVECSSGTYVRSLIHDIGQSIGCGATMVELTRLTSGSFDINDAIQISDLVNDVQNGDWTRHLISPANAISSFKSIDLVESDLESVLYGREIELEAEGDLIIAATPRGQPAAMLSRVKGTSKWHPIKVFLQPKR